MADPTVGALTSQSQIEVDWVALTGTIDTGNSAILSYNLYWDNGSGSTPSISLTDSLVTSYTIIGVTSGYTYKFMVRAKNINGYGSFSNSVSITATSEPGIMSPVTTTQVGTTDVKIAWTVTSTGGSSI
jgi:hypothetical protein